MIRVVRRGPRADQGGRRYWLSNGWFIDGDNLHSKRHYHEHRYSAWEPGASATGGAAFRGSANRLQDLLGQLDRSIAYELQLGDVHFHWTPANPQGRIWAHLGRAGGWIGGGEWLSGPAFSAACRVWADTHRPAPAGSLFPAGGVDDLRWQRERLPAPLRRPANLYDND